MMKYAEIIRKDRKSSIIDTYIEFWKKHEKLFNIIKIIPGLKNVYEDLCNMIYSMIIYNAEYYILQICSLLSSYYMTKDLYIKYDKILWIKDCMRSLMELFENDYNVAKSFIDDQTIDFFIRRVVVEDPRYYLEEESKITEENDQLLKWLDEILKVDNLFSDNFDKEIHRMLDNIVLLLDNIALNYKGDAVTDFAKKFQYNMNKAHEDGYKIFSEKTPLSRREISYDWRSIFTIDDFLKDPGSVKLFIDSYMKIPIPDQYKYYAHASDQNINTAIEKAFNECMKRITNGK